MNFPISPPCCTNVPPRNKFHEVDRAAVQPIAVEPAVSHAVKPKTYTIDDFDKIPDDRLDDIITSSAYTPLRKALPKIRADRPRLLPIVIESLFDKAGNSYQHHMTVASGLREIRFMTVSNVWVANRIFGTLLEKCRENCVDHPKILNAGYQTMFSLLSHEQIDHIDAGFLLKEELAAVSKKRFSKSARNGWQNKSSFGHSCFAPGRKR